jgi:hypothetical protein
VPFFCVCPVLYASRVTTAMTYIIHTILKWLQYSIVFHMMKGKHHSVSLYSVS